jgi:hypothetical protein
MIDTNSFAVTPAFAGVTSTTTSFDAIPNAVAAWVPQAVATACSSTAVVDAWDAA